MKKVAVIGAGWAGLAAATTAAEQGAAVSLFEAGRVAGGRARAVSGDGFSFLDNGQHLLIADYAAVFGWLRRLGVDVETAFRREPMCWHMADGVQFQAAPYLPKPLNVLIGILKSASIGLPEKWAIIRQLAALRRWQSGNAADITVLKFMNDQQVSQKWRDEFWQPMVWGALNTPLDTADLRVLANVLADGAGSDFCLPKVDLGTLAVQPALQKLAQWGGRFFPETRVGRLRCVDNQILLENQLFDRVIVAVAPYHLAALLPENGAKNIQAAVSSFHYHAITTVYLRYPNPPQLPVLMTGLAYGTAQWLIDRRRLNGANEVAAVISVSEQHGSLKAEEWAARVHADVLRVLPHVGEPLAVQVITEKRATVAGTAQRQRFGKDDIFKLNQCGIFVAGDYLHERYPATLEAAVCSGIQAAKDCLK